MRTTQKNCLICFILNLLAICFFERSVFFLLSPLKICLSDILNAHISFICKLTMEYPTKALVWTTTRTELRTRSCPEISNRINEYSIRSIANRMFISQARLSERQITRHSKPKHKIRNLQLNFISSSYRFQALEDFPLVNGPEVEGYQKHFLHSELKRRLFESHSNGVVQNKPTIRFPMHPRRRSRKDKCEQTAYRSVGRSVHVRDSINRRTSARISVANRIPMAGNRKSNLNKNINIKWN